MVDTIKFSQFAYAGNLVNDETTVGLANGNNARFNNPWTFLPSGTTAERPEPETEMYYRLRFNTTDFLYEYYNADIPAWVQLDDEDTVLALLASHDAGEGASLIGLENQSTITNKTVQDLANAAILAQTNNGTLVNGVYLDLMTSGIVTVTNGTGDLNSISLAGTTNQINVANANGISGSPTFSISSTLILPGTLKLGGTLDVNNFGFINSQTNGGFSFTTTGAGLWTLNATQGITGISNDPTFSADSEELVPTQAAVKALVATGGSGFSFVTGGPCVAASTVNFVGTYNNGADGVGATIEQSVAAVVVIDGVTVGLNGRVLLKNQTDETENGIYALTTLGTISVQAIFTRTTDYDEPSEIVPGSLVPIIPGGTVNGGSVWGETSTVTAIGTDPITFQIIAQPSNTFVTLATNQNITGIKTFNSGSLLLKGSVSGTTSLIASAAAGGVITFPAVTDTAVTNNAAATLTTKTIDGGSNTLTNIPWASIANNTVGAIAGWNAAGVATPISPGPTGYVLTSTGLSTPPTYQASTAGSMAPTQQKFINAGSGTYTTPTSPAPLYIRVQMVGAGGGGGGGGVNTAATGGLGGSSTFGSILTCTGGTGGSFGAYGGTAGSATLSSPAYGIAIQGSYGDPGTFINTNSVSASFTASGGNGGASYFGGQGGGGPNGFAGLAGGPNTGGGGGGGGRAGTTLAASSGGGGGSGGYIEAYITSPSSSYSYTVGAGGAGGAATSYGGVGGAGGSGVIIVTEYYQ